MIFVVLWLAANVAWIAAVIDAGNQPPESYAATRRSKSGTVWVVLLTGWLGLIYYATVVRPALKRAPIAPAESSDGTKYCKDCGMSRFPADASRCTNCGSERLVPGAPPRTRWVRSFI